ncbi:MAG: hypothetical protein RQ875_12955 [Vicingaceae bacterium]|nr:hypothetical protein [Vicingaceae bacterium]
MRKCTVILMLLFLTSISYSQQNSVKIAPWSLLSYGGNINLNGQYYNSTFLQEGTQNFGYQYSPGGFISTQSYVYHPNFLTLNISGGYQPQFGEVISSITPDYLTSISLLQYNVNAAFLKTLDYKVNAYYNYNQKNGVDRFYDRDITTKKWGAGFIYDGSYKVRTNFEHNDTHELDNYTDRELLVSVTYLKGSVMKSFFKNDRNELDFNLQTTLSESKDLFKNSSDLIYIGYNNMFFLNKKQTITSNSKLFISKQKGTSNNIEEGLSESILFPIAKQLTFNSKFSLIRRERESQLTKELNLGGSLNHSIYQSLQNNLLIQYNNNNQEGIYNFGNVLINFNTNYNKKIPFIKGDINIVYEFDYQHQNRESKDNLVSIYNEKKLFEDGSIVLLNSPNIIIESVLVKDVTGTIIYQENLDYILIQRGVNTEIQRLAGGIIQNNTLVFIDYNTFQNSSYDYNSPGSKFETRLTFFDRLLMLSYTNSYRNYKSISSSLDGLGLNTFKRYKYGAYLRYKIFNGGISYEDNESSVLPYRLWNYYFSANGSISKKINFKIYGMVNNYSMYFIEGDKNKLSSISSDISYNISNTARFLFNFSYSAQKGDIQDYHLISARGDIKKRINQLELSLGVNYFNRKVPYEENSSQYIGTNIKIQRNF